MEEQIIYRIKNIVTGNYWTGDGFGSGGKIYTKRKFAHGAMTDGRLGNMISTKVYDANNIKVVKATIINEEIL